MRAAVARAAVAAFVLGGADLVGADPSRFERATDLMRAGDSRAAAYELVQLADDEPDSLFADDALFEAGKLYEERLGDPMRALALYRRLVVDYPHSRASLAASRRIESLRNDVGPNGDGAEALARFNEIRHRYPDRAPAESLAQMKVLLDAYPTWAGAPRAAMWLARVHEREGQLERAAARYREVARRWPQSTQAFVAHRSAGQIAIRRGQLEAARRHFAAMDPGDDRGRQQARRDVDAQLAREVWRARWYLASYLALALVVAVFAASARRAAGSWRGAMATMGTPPTEAIYLAPIAAVLFVAAATGHEQIAPAAAIILLGGIVVSWLSGAVFAHPSARTRMRIMLHALASAVAVVALVYIAIHRTRLVDLIVETVRFGPAH